MAVMYRPTLLTVPRARSGYRMPWPGRWRHLVQPSRVTLDQAIPIGLIGIVRTSRIGPADKPIVAVSDQAALVPKLVHGISVVDEIGDICDLSVMDNEDMRLKGIERFALALRGHPHQRERLA